MNSAKSIVPFPSSSAWFCWVTKKVLFHENEATFYFENQAQVKHFISKGAYGSVRHLNPFSTNRFDKTKRHRAPTSRIISSTSSSVGWFPKDLNTVPSSSASIVPRSREKKDRRWVQLCRSHKIWPTDPTTTYNAIVRLSPISCILFKRWRRTPASNHTRLCNNISLTKDQSSRARNNSPSPSLSKREKASLNSAISSSEYWCAMLVTIRRFAPIYWWISHGQYRYVDKKGPPFNDSCCGRVLLAENWLQRFNSSV